MIRITGKKNQIATRKCENFGSNRMTVEELKLSALAS
jgi:hypothetical protein